jgi:translocation and assembly module TamA
MPRQTHDRRDSASLLWTALLRAAAAAALLSCAIAPAAETPKYKVEIVAPPALAKLLQANLDIVRWSARSDVTQDQLEQLYLTTPQQIETLLATEGYFSPKVQSTLEQPAGKWIAKFEVTPGEPTKVTSVQIDFSGAVTRDPDRDKRLAQARKAFTIKPGDIFRQAGWEEAKASAVRSLTAFRFATAHVATSRAEIDPQTRAARLSLNIDSGPPVTFGAVRVKGQKRYPEKLIANLNPVHAGEPYSEDALLKYQRRLQATGRFASALVLAPADAQAPGDVPIDVTVVESQSRRLGFGVGYSTDSGARVQTNYTDYDFLYKSWKFTADVTVDRLTQTAGIGLEWPVEPSGWHWGSGLRYKHEDIQGQDTRSYSLTGARIHTTEERESSLSLQYLEEHTSVEDTQANNHALFLNQGWVFNHLDNILAPRAGYLIKLQLGGATKLVLSDQNFARTTAKVQYLHPVWNIGTLSLRAEAGVVFAKSTDGIPSDYLFRTGGDTTVRGYAFDSLGVAQGSAVVGGRYLAVASAEYIHWLTKAWGLAIFYDAGNAADDAKGLKPDVGYGVGVRWSSPVGALNLDIAHGVQAPDPWRIHFFAGISFQ